MTLIKLACILLANNAPSTTRGVAMVTSKKVTKPGIKAPAKRAAAKAAPAKAVVAKAPVETVAPAKPVVAKRKSTVKAAPATATVSAAAKKPAAVKKAATPKKAASARKSTISAEQRNNYVEVAAFYIAERRGFASANPADDWIEAEAEIDRLIATGHFAG
jgi:hypothetical protein